MKKYILIIDGYGSVQDDNWDWLKSKYDAFAEIGVPVAMYEQIQYFNNNKPKQDEDIQ